jgi:hypothetical protein
MRQFTILGPMYEGRYAGQELGAHKCQTAAKIARGERKLKRKKAKKARNAYRLACGLQVSNQNSK